LPGAAAPARAIAKRWPVVSIVLPVVDQARCLPAAIHSVLVQPFRVSIIAFNALTKLA
jgi:hypothetical protein